MRRRQNNHTLDAINAFGVTYGMTNKISSAMDQSKIASATPETSNGFTESQGQQIQAAADSGQYDIAYNEGKGSYDVTPKEGGETGSLAQQQKTTFLGKTYDKALSDQEIGKARMSAMAGVYAKHGEPEKAMQLEQQARQGDLTELQIKGAERQDRAATQEEEYKNSLKGWMENSRWGQVQKSNQELTGQHAAAVADYEAKIKAGADPKTLGMPPAAPQKQSYGIGDSLYDTTSFLAHDAKYGKFDPQKWMAVTEKAGKIQSEGYERALLAADGGAPLEKVAAEFNKSGDVKFDPKTVISDRMGKTNVRGQQIDTRIISYKDEKGNVQTLNVAAELAGIGGTKEILANHFAAKEGQRSEQRLGMEGARLGMAQQEMGERKSDKAEAKAKIKEKEEAAVALFHQRNPNASEADLRAVRNGILSAVPDKTEISSDFKPDGMGSGGTAVQKLRDGSIVATRVNPNGKTTAPIVIPAPGAAATGGSVARPQSNEDFSKLPKGSLYIDPDDGKQYRKP